MLQQQDVVALKS